MKKEQKWNIFFVKIEDKDDERSTQHVIAGPRLQPIDKGDIEGCDIRKPYYDLYVTNCEMV